MYQSKSNFIYSTPFIQWCETQRALHQVKTKHGRKAIIMQKRTTIKFIQNIEKL